MLNIDPDLLNNHVMVTHFKHDYIADSTVDLLVISIVNERCLSTDFYKCQKIGGYMSGDLVIISLTSAIQYGWNSWSIFPLNIISTLMSVLLLLL